MKNLSPFKLICCLLIPVILQSCSNEIGAWKNDQIKQSNRDELHELNKQVFKYLKANDDKSLGAYLSKELLDDNYAKGTLESIGLQLNKDSFVVFNDYYVVNKYVGADTINTKDLGVNSFRLVYPGTAEEMYISMFVPKNAATPNKSMITTVYAHYSYGWKLSSITAGIYTINGKTAPQLYEKARKEYDENYLFAAANTMSLATSCSRPNDIWQYMSETEIYDFSKTVTNAANTKFHFPMVLNQVSSKPRIIRMYNNTSNEGTYPIICYITKINLKDIAALNRENYEMKKIIGTIMPGIDKSTKFLYYAAYNEMPASNKVVPHYDIKDTPK
nr:hypothetical protein [Mucilaginibacter sp. L294]